MIENTWILVSRSLAGYVSGGYGGSCKQEEWSLGEGIFLEGCKCHPEREKLIAVIWDGDDEEYSYFSVVAAIDGAEIAEAARKRDIMMGCEK